MSTRALYTFDDGQDKFTVFKHYDGYPEAHGAYHAIARAIPYAWELPRFEADEFAAAFVVGNKKSEGNVRLTNGDTTNGDVMGIEYWYTITLEGKRLKVATRRLWDGEDLPAVYIDKHGKVIMPATKPAELTELPL